MRVCVCISVRSRLCVCVCSSAARRALNEKRSRLVESAQMAAEDEGSRAAEAEQRLVSKELDARRQWSIVAVRAARRGVERFAAVVRLPAVGVTSCVCATVCVRGCVWGRCERFAPPPPSPVPLFLCDVLWCCVCVSHVSVHAWTGMRRSGRR